jgi:hypothetical protein
VVTETIKFAYDALDSHNGTILLDCYDHQSVKYCGVLLLVFNSTTGVHDQWMLSFQRLDITTDAATRERLEEVLERYGVKIFYDQNVRICPIKALLW